MVLIHIKVHIICEKNDKNKNILRIMFWSRSDCFLGAPYNNFTVTDNDTTLFCGDNDDTIDMKNINLAEAVLESDNINYHRRLSSDDSDNNDCFIIYREMIDGDIYDDCQGAASSYYVEIGRVIGYCYTDEYETDGISYKYVCEGNSNDGNAVRYDYNNKYCYGTPDASSDINICQGCYSTGTAFSTTYQATDSNGMETTKENMNPQTTVGDSMDSDSVGYKNKAGYLYFCFIGALLSCCVP